MIELRNRKYINSHCLTDEDYLIVYERVYKDFPQRSYRAVILRAMRFGDKRDADIMLSLPNHSFQRR